ncbi:TPA: hypothetical protein ACH3X2_012138 [Trebouxia sp. C0005]
MHHLSLACLQHNFLVMQLHMLRRLDIYIAQGLGLLPYNKHSEIELCAEVKPISALLPGMQQTQVWHRAFSSALLTGFTKSVMPSGLLFLPLYFMNSGILQVSGNDLTICKNIFTSSFVGMYRPLRTACQCRHVSLPSRPLATLLTSS